MDHRMTRFLAKLAVFLAAGAIAAPAWAQGYTPPGMCPTHQWNYAYGSMTNAADCLQPGFADISGTIASGQVSGSYTGITGIGTLTTKAATTVAPTSAWGFDGSGQTLTVATGANTTLAAGNGLIVVYDDRGYGALVLALQSGSTIDIVAGNTSIFVASSSPASGQTGIATSGTAVTVYNNTGGSRTYSIAMLRGA
jgi:hypothetical protein